MLDNIVDIDDQEHFKGVKQRLEIVKGQVDEAIQQFEQGKVESVGKTQAKAESDLLQKEIIDLLIKGDYQPDKIGRIAAKAAGLNDVELNILLAVLYNNWGTYLGKLAQTQAGGEAEALYRQAFDKYQKAIELKPDDHEIYYNWGTDLGNMAQTQTGGEAEALHRLALEKFQKAVGFGGKCYNLACSYALMQDKDNALLYLNRSLENKEENKEENIEFVTADTDWAGFLDDEDFKTVINRYAKL